MLRRVALVRTDVSEERDKKRGTRNNVSPPSNDARFVAIRSSETSLATTAIWCNIAEDGIPHSHRRENLKSYIALTGWTL
jgi:hypothetical protein